VAAAGNDAAEHGSGLTGEHEADEEGVFGEDQQPNQDVGENRVDIQDAVDQATHDRLPGS
jgi:hypothetical protein